MLRKLALGALLAAAGAPATALAASWRAPFRLAGPLPIDVLPTRIALSSGGQAAVGFGLQDEDNPADSRAFVVLRSPTGRLAKARRVAGADEVLGLTFSGTRLSVLAAGSPKASQCCASVELVTAGRRARTLASTLSGAAVGQLLTLPGGRLFSAFADGEGVWAARSPFARVRRLTTAAPGTFATTTLLSGRPAVAFTQGSGGTIWLAAPRPRAAFTIAASHEIDELGLASSRTATAGWIESWFDPAGAYHAQAVVADLSRSPRARAFPIAGQVASGISLAGDARGDQVLTWKACVPLGLCTAYASTRRGGRGFSPLVALGRIDAGQDPASAIGPSGAALVGWVSGGRVLAAVHPARAARFRPPSTVSSTRLAADLTIAFGPRGNAIAAWTQGTLAPSVIGAMWR